MRAVEWEGAHGAELTEHENRGVQCHGDLAGGTGRVAAAAISESASGDGCGDSGGFARRERAS